MRLSPKWSRRSEEGPERAKAEKNRSVAIGMAMKELLENNEGNWT